MKKFLSALIVLTLTSAAAFADCRPAYQQATETLAAQIRGEKTALFTNGAIGAVAAGAMIAAGAVAPPVMIMNGTVFFVSFVKERALAHRYKSVRFVSRVIDEAYKGEGPRLDKLVQKLQKKHQNVSTQELSQWIIAANESNILCTIDDETGRLKLASDSQLFRHALKEVTEQK